LEQGIQARVYNLSRSGTDTSRILQRLPEQLDYFRPQIVVSMMGINDNGVRFVPPRASWLHAFRVVQLYRWFVLGFARPETAQEAAGPASKSLGDPLAMHEVETRLQ